MRAHDQDLPISLKSGIRLRILFLNFVAFLIIFALVYLNQYIFIRGKPGTSIIFVLYPFIMEFVTVWGIWGIITSYFGVAAGLLFFSSFDPLQSLMLAFIYIIPATISFATYRSLISSLSLDPLKRDLLSPEINGVKTKRPLAWMIFLVFDAILLNVFQVLLGLYYLNAIGFFTRNDDIYWFYVWSFSNFISYLIIEPILIKTMTESLEELGLVLNF